VANIETVVCPLGRYGKCYRLDPKLYRYYSWLTRACWSLAVPLFALQLLGLGDRLGSISWPHNLPGEIATGLCVATLFGQISIASRGQAANAAESEARLTVLRNSTFTRVHRKLAVVSGLFLLVLVGIAVSFQVSTGKPLQVGEVLFVTLVGAVFFYLYKTRRRNGD